MWNWVNKSIKAFFEWFDPLPEEESNFSLDYPLSTEPFLATQSEPSSIASINIQEQLAFPQSLANQEQSFIPAASLTFELSSYSCYRYQNSGGTLQWLCDDLPSSQEAAQNLITEIGACAHEIKIIEELQRVLPPTEQVDITTEWASDDLIHLFMSGLVKAHSSSKKIGWIDAWYQEGKPREIQEKEQARIIANDLILIPISKGNHWYLTLIERCENTLNIYAVDSFNTIPEHEILFTIIKERLLARLYPNFSGEIRERSFLIPPQNNEKDCGFIVCALAYLAVHHGVGALAKFKNHWTLECDYQATRLFFLQRVASQMNKRAAIAPSDVVNCLSSKP